MANVNVNYGEMQQQATRLLAAQQDISGRLHSLQSEIETLVSTGFVTDSASGQFATAYHSFHGGAQQAMEGLAGMARYLDQAVEAYAAIDTDLSRALT